jgi:hypothetical protein
MMGVGCLFLSGTSALLGLVDYINNGQHATYELHFSQVSSVPLTNILDKEMKHHVKLYSHHTQIRAVGSGRL